MRLWRFYLYKLLVCVTGRVMKNDMSETIITTYKAIAGNVALFPLKSLRDVAIYTRTAFEKLESQGGIDDDLRYVFVNKNVSPDSIPAAPLPKRNDYHFVITTPAPFRSFIMMWLNTSLGIGELMDYDFHSRKGVVTKKKLESVLLPLLKSSMEYSVLGLIDDFAWVAVNIENNENAETLRMKSVASIFYSRVAEYAAMQLLVPEEFEKAGVDIIGSWHKLLRDEFKPEDDITFEDVTKVVNEAFRTNNDLMLNVNRMKLYNSRFYPRCVEILDKANEKISLK